MMSMNTVQTTKNQPKGQGSKGEERKQERVINNISRSGQIECNPVQSIQSNPIQFNPIECNPTQFSPIQLSSQFNPIPIQTRPNPFAHPSIVPSNPYPPCTSTAQHSTAPLSQPCPNPNPHQRHHQHQQPRISREKESVARDRGLSIPRLDSIPRWCITPWLGEHSLVGVSSVGRYRVIKVSSTKH